MFSGNLTLIQQNSITETKIWDKKVFYIFHKFVNNCNLCRFFSYDKKIQSSLIVNAYFHCLPMISGKLTPIPQNSITKATAWNEKFFHISHKFVNKMRLVPILLFCS